MDNLRAVIKALFCGVTSQMILCNQVSYDSIENSLFQRLGNRYVTRYSNDELKNMYQYLSSEFEWQNHRIRNAMLGEKGRHHINVFDAIVSFDFEVLTEENWEPVCKYQHLLRWREMITELDEDLFVTSFLAMNDQTKNCKRHYFSWKPVIGHNQFALNKLVSRGVAENHFHLKGSSQMFHLSWLSLMNQVDNVAFIPKLKKYNDHKLQMFEKINIQSQKEPDDLVVMWRQAALIRVFLFAKLHGEKLELGGENEGIQLKMLLTDPDYFEANISTVQLNIEHMQNLFAKSEYDYTICERWLVSDNIYEKNVLLSGERYFLYSVFQKIFSLDNQWLEYGNLFYLYLILKIGIRSELIQSNKTVGFDNFALYQDRKENFIEGTKYEKPYVRMAVRDTIENQHICSLEARISPSDDSQQIIGRIEKYDDWITENLSQEGREQLKEKYFYVVHFVKKVDKAQIAACRHVELRKVIMRQAKAIACAREESAVICERIHGIDACAAEIGCRPEVFGQAYRYLKNHQPNQENMSQTIQPRGLMATYHVGEDFLDIIDGLRAIDEVIHFLNFRCGDRLGHALALGVDVAEWYNGKANRVLISRQDYLDNLVWLYAKLRRYHITGCENAKIYIEKRFSELFDEIYRNYIYADNCVAIMEAAECRFNQYQIPHGYHKRELHFGIEEYYDAWKLRGDNPECYSEGYFYMEEIPLSEWDYYSVNREWPANYRIRYSPEVALLYYMYHYDENVKKAGRQVVEVKVGQSIIEAVIEVQKSMQNEIAAIGIGIEANPSSNYLIGTFRRYDCHPITCWYNKGLTQDLQKLLECPQLQVSINTDDQGIFFTYLENEYAYLALALEKAKDKNGNLLYKRSDIMDWLENLRKNGIDQAFI